MTLTTKGEQKREFVGWSACSTCIFAYGVDSDNARCAYDKITKKWYHVNSKEHGITGTCFRSPEPMEVMV